MLHSIPFIIIASGVHLLDILHKNGLYLILSWYNNSYCPNSFLMGEFHLLSFTLEVFWISSDFDTRNSSSSRFLERSLLIGNTISCSMQSKTANWPNAEASAHQVQLWLSDFSMDWLQRVVVRMSHPKSGNDDSKADIIMAVSSSCNDKYLWSTT